MSLPFILAGWSWDVMPGAVAVIVLYENAEAVGGKRWKGTGIFPIMVAQFYP
jgi:hypothetical protein